MIRFDSSEITQEMDCIPAPDNSCMILKAVSGKGYQYALKRKYMEEVRKLLEGNREKKDFHRLLFVTPDHRLSRQAYLTIRKSLEEGNETAEEDEYAQLYAQCNITVAAPELQVAVITEKQNRKEGAPAGMEDIHFRSQKRRRKETSPGTGPDETEGILLELGNMDVTDEKVEEILMMQDSWVALSIPAGGSCEYLVSRLAFEGGYEVVRLKKPSREDFLDCADAFLSHHHFQVEREALEDMLEELQRFRGNLLREQDVYLHLNRSMQKAMADGRHELWKGDLALDYPRSAPDVRKRWDQMVGLEKAKTVLYRRICARKVMGDRGVALHGNYILGGNPGTGKTEMAGLLAQMMGEMGISNGRCVVAARADFIGQYLGQTAVKMKEIFERADGGVLFVDEASFLLDREDRYVQEAVVEFVRFMECCPQTTVLFATYPEQAVKLLDIDPGFRSRIQQVIAFPDYSDEQLYSILQVMAGNAGLVLEEGACQEELGAYLEKIRKREHFGNAREVRKLLETAVEEYGMEENEKGSDGDGVICGRHLRRAAEYLLADMPGKKSRTLGFVVQEQGNG